MIYYIIVRWYNISPYRNSSMLSHRFIPYHLVLWYANIFYIRGWNPIIRISHISFRGWLFNPPISLCLFVWWGE